MFSVLIVEDEPNVRRGLVKTTNWEKHDVEDVYEAANGIEALKIIEKQEIDIVITDIKMPLMDGIELIHEIALLKYECSIILVTAFDEFEYAHQAIKYDVVDMLIKPFKEHDFDLAIQNAIQRNKQLKFIEIYKQQENITDIVDDIDQITHKQTREMIEYIHNNFSDSSLSILSVASYLRVSESLIVKLFKRNTSMTFNEYLTNYRLTIAMELLDESDLLIYEIADKVGYKDQRYFSSLFKKHIGVTPNQFRNKKLK